jgi:hypothetical protein
MKNQNQNMRLVRVMLLQKPQKTKSGGQEMKHGLEAIGMKTQVRKSQRTGGLLSLLAYSQSYRSAKTVKQS